MKQEINKLKKYYGDRQYLYWIIIAVVALFVFAGVMLTRSETNLKMFNDSHNATTGNYVCIGVIFTVLFVVCMILFLLSKVTKNYVLFGTVALCTAAAVACRFVMLDFISGDYQWCLSQWVDEMRGMNIRQAFTTSIGDYNMPYLYILYFISKIDFPDLYSIKLVSFLFDILLAFSVMKLVSLKNQKENILSFAFISSLFIPTVIMNSAFWAQCDVIYSSICLLALYLALKDKQWTACCLFGLAFSIKIQTVFILPVVIVLIMLKKMKPKAVMGFVAAFFVMLLPALLLGRSFQDTLSIYADQTASYPKLSLNTHSLYTFVPENNYFDSLNLLAILIAVVGCCVMLYFVYTYRKKFTQSDIVTIAFIFTAMIPFLLPRMHDRYFYMCDALAVVYAFYNPKKWYVPLVFLSCSYIDYAWFLFDSAVLVNARIRSLAFMLCLIIVIKDFVKKTITQSKYESDNINNDKSKELLSIK